MQDLIRHLPAVIFEYAIHPNGDEGFNYISEGCANILGLKPEALRQDHVLLYSIVHEDDLPFLKKGIEQTSARKGTWLWKGRVYVKSEIKWVEFRSNDEVTREGVILRRGIIQDVDSDNNRTVEEPQGYQKEDRSAVQEKHKSQPFFCRNQSDRLCRRAEATM